MLPTATPLLSALTTLAAGMLMLLAGIKKRKLGWRPPPVERPRRPGRVRRPRA